MTQTLQERTSPKLKPVQNKDVAKILNKKAKGLMGLLLSVPAGALMGGIGATSEYDLEFSKEFPFMLCPSAAEQVAPFLTILPAINSKGILDFLGNATLNMTAYTAAYLVAYYATKYIRTH
jgi:hypothetical protein